MAKINFLEIAKAAGLGEHELKGKSQIEIMNLVYSTLAKEKTVFEVEAEKSIIENGNKQIEKLKEFFKEPFEIFVRKVGQKKSPAAVKVIGYDVSTSEIIVTHADKCVRIGDDDFIKSLDELAESRANKKSKPKKGKK